jgi:hypothetical protein
VGLIAQDDIGYVRDRTGIICGAVDIVDWDRVGEGACGDVIELRSLNVNEATSGAAVNEGLCASLDRSVRRLNLYIHCEGHRSWARYDDVFDR